MPPNAILHPIGYNPHTALLFYTRSGAISHIIRYLYTLKYTTMQQNLSAFVKEMRKNFNLTQTDLADKSGVGLRFVRELEQGKPTLRLDKINQVLALFGKKIGVVNANE